LLKRLRGLLILQAFIVLNQKISCSVFAAARVSS